ncbi:MAG: helix-turn-helix domain-containing protein [Anaerovoracaceae bacterium]
MNELKPNEKFVMTPREAGEYVCLGENKIRELCQTGEIKAIRYGSHWKIARPILEQFILDKTGGEI